MDKDEQTITQWISDYVDSNKLIEQIDTTNPYVNENIIKYIVEIDVNQLSEQNNLLAQYMAKDVNRFINLMREHIADKLTEIRQKKTQVWLHIKPTHLSNTGDIESAQCFTTISGAQIVSLSVEHRSPIAAKYVCNQCVNHMYDEWIIRESNKTSEDVLTANIMCGNCGEILSRSAEKRDTVYALKRSAILETQHFKRCEVSIWSDIFEKECCVYIGAQFDSAVVVQQTRELIALETRAPIIQTKFSQLIDSLPFRIRPLYLDRKASPYSFGLSLAYAFADTVSADGSYFRLKLGLILSLLSCDDLQKRYSSILAVSSDTTLVCRIMQFASGFATPRFVQSSPLLPITGTSRKESRDTWIDGGALLLSTDGVCVIPHILELPEKEKTLLGQAIQDNKVLVKMPAPDITTFECELRASIWSVIENRTQSYNRKSLSTKMKHNSTNWLNVFPMVYVIEEDLNNFFEPKPDENSLTCDEWQQFFDLLKRIPTPEMTIGAQNLLSGYYIATRKTRGFNCKINAMETLTSLAKSFAKLNLKSYVSKSEALIAILLYEESLTHQFGYSPLEVYPISHITDSEQMCDELGLQFDKNMDSFEKKLNYFIESHGKPIKEPLSQFVSNNMPREE